MLKANIEGALTSSAISHLSEIVGSPLLYHDCWVLIYSISLELLLFFVGLYKTNLINKKILSDSNHEYSKFALHNRFVKIDQWRG